MTELVNIKYNTKGEKPQKGYQIIYVRSIPHAKEVLDNFKNAVLTILKNIKLNDEDSKWNNLLPQGIVTKTKQLDSDDYANDEFLTDIDISIYKYQKIKDWEWYSSLEVENGFDIIVKGNFNTFQFISFIHCQNAPLANIRLVDVDKNKMYELRTIKDYTTYKILK
ncbi:MULTISPECIES: hypothetical protein [unclassified Empedobacter]|uniref:hypothetical protein n=1 Tax=unclassified Empedobacter TaxID=2643773 RepID=UPI0025C34523|nr:MULTISPECIES: hypothetical protein [unclassified Empedobacter]